MKKILVIAEKPSAGRDIARVLGVTTDYHSYMENEKYIVTWALGHLVELKDPEDNNPRYKIWKTEDIPLPADNGLRIKERGREQFDVIQDLIARQDIDYIINAGDAGREGLLIQSWIYRMAGNRHAVKILWASSLTDEAIMEAMKRLHTEEETEFVNLLREAETRAIADQVYGYNYTRLLTCLYANKGTVLSYGRCQTPLLNLIAIRDIENETFKPQPYWNVEVQYGRGFSGTEIDDENKAIHYIKKEEAEKSLQECMAAEAAVIKCICEDKQEKAPKLLNLAELQSIMGKKYGFTPDKTLELAQSLYEKHKIMSYPRTDSQYLSTDLYGEMEAHVRCCDFGKYGEYIGKIDFAAFSMDKAYFNNNKVSDHHALIPTINKDIPKIYETLSPEEKSCFDEVVLRLIAIFLPPYEYKATEVITKVGAHFFKTSGTTIKEYGYKALYRDSESEKEEVIIPVLEEGTSLTMERGELKEGKTKPRTKYTPGNIIKLMGKYKIGTSATSAGIVQGLINRGFLKLEKNKYTTTETGRKLLQYIPEELKSADMTIRFEEKLQRVNAGDLSREDFLEDIKTEIQKNKNLFMERGVGEKLGKENVLHGVCPQCGRKMKIGKKGWFCEGYSQTPECKFTIWKTVAGKDISDADAESLLLKGKSRLIKGFKSKKGKAFNAYLVIEKDASNIAQVVFQFEKTKKSKK